MSGNFNPPETDGEMTVLIGCAPVATMRGYHTEVTAYTRGKGRLLLNLKGYLPCHNSDEVVRLIGYDSERDLDNPTGSIFCAHGAGFIVEWDKVQDHMHVDSEWQERASEELKEEPVTAKPNTAYRNSWQEDKELEAIYVRTFGPVKHRHNYSQSELRIEKKDIIEKVQTNHKTVRVEKEPVKEYLLVDGYNIIFSWDTLNELAMVNMDAARNKLMDILCNYEGFKKCIVILVFDAYKVKGGAGEVLKYHNIHVVYTKEAETADEYIEKVTHDIARRHLVTVATSDALEQLIIMGQGAIRLSANDLKEKITRVREQIHRDYLDKQPTGRAYLREQFDDNILEILEDDSNTSNS
jgi:predicted RNA-binding protein with PIN domain